MNTREERAAKRSQVSRMTTVSKQRSTGHAQAWSPGFHRLEGGRQGRDTEYLCKYCQLLLGKKSETSRQISEQAMRECGL